MCLRTRLPAVFLLAALAAAAASPAWAAPLFTVTTPNNRINELDADTGLLLNSFAPPVPVQFGGGNGLAYSGTALYYTTILEPLIFTLNPATGATLGTIPRPAGSSIDALGYGTSGFGPTLFALDYTPNRLFLLNPTTGAVFTSYVVGFDALGGIDFNSARGTLYVSDGAGVVRELNPDTGAVLTSFGAGTSVIGLGLVGGRLFTAPFGTGTITERNPLTGAILRTFPSPGGEASALAGGPAGGVIPEPSALALVTAGVLAWIARRRWRGCERPA